MNLEQQVTSLEISKKLKELGVKNRSYFVWFFNTPEKPYAPKWELRPWDNEFGRTPNDWSNKDFVRSAFTVAELGELLPHWQATRKTQEGRYMGWDINPPAEYLSLVQDILIEETEADARGKLLIYLLENHLISPGTKQ